MIKAKNQKRKMKMNLLYSNHPKRLVKSRPLFKFVINKTLTIYYPLLNSNNRLNALSKVNKKPRSCMNHNPKLLALNKKNSHKNNSICQKINLLKK